jgi:hypothetical protein
MGYFKAPAVDTEGAGWSRHVATMHVASDMSWNAFVGARSDLRAPEIPSLGTQGSTSLSMPAQFVMMLDLFAVLIHMTMLWES